MGKIRTLELSEEQRDALRRGYQEVSATPLESLSDDAVKK
jgi:hypothetical protein